jgi:hypothetical protein
LHIDHHANTPLQLKKSCGLLLGQHLPQDRHILLPKLGCRDVRIQPAANETICLLFGQSSVLIGVFFNQRNSRAGDLSEIRQILLDYGPELTSFVFRQSQLSSNELFIDRANVLAQLQQLPVHDRVGTDDIRDHR